MRKGKLEMGKDLSNMRSESCYTERIKNEILDSDDFFKTELNLCSRFYTAKNLNTMVWREQVLIRRRIILK